MIRKPPEPISREELRELVVQMGSPDRAVEDVTMYAPSNICSQAASYLFL